MGYNLITNIATCYSDIPRLLYYSHIPTAIVVLFFGIFVLVKSRGKELASKILFAIAIAFSAWVLIEGAIWLVYNSMTMMFLWSLLGMLYILIHILSLYFVYAIIDGKDISFIKKIILGLIFLPTVILTPTQYNLSGFDIMSCSAMENNYFIYCRYFTGFLLIIWIIVLLLYRYFKAKEEAKRRIALLGLGILSFLFLFSWSEIAASLTQNWDITQYGLFGAPIFIAFLAYLSVKHKIFDIKLIGSQVLLFSMVILISSQFFFIQNHTNRILTGITLVLVMGIGYSLIRSVKLEIKRREEIAALAASLEKANVRLQELDHQKTEFLSIASHQLRTPLSIIKGYIELIEDGAFGKPTKKMADTLHDMDESNERLVNLVDEFLNITRIEQGRTKFNFEYTDPNSTIASIMKELHDKAEAKGLKVIFTPNSNLQKVYLDEEKIRNVIFNFVDNAIKYTDKGDIKISLEEDEGGMTLRVKDNGFGFGSVDQANFFQKFYRGQNVVGTNVNGTGLGLYVCAKFVESHDGRVWANSDGLGKGSEFGFWIPLKTPPKNVPAVK